jgi:hypothetical protein
VRLGFRQKQTGISENFAGSFFRGLVLPRRMHRFYERAEKFGSAMMIVAKNG